MARQDKHRRKRPLPPANRVPQNLDEMAHIPFQISGISVHSWTPLRDGKGMAEQVHLMFEVHGVDAGFVMRFKTPAAVDELIEALQRHRNDVWPGVET